VLGRWAGQGVSSEGVRLTTAAGLSRSELEKLTADKKTLDASLEKPTSKVRGPACWVCCEYQCCVGSTGGVCILLSLYIK
jgi:hypothetical protein